MPSLQLIGGSASKSEDHAVNMITPRRLNAENLYRNIVFFFSCAKCSKLHRRFKKMFFSKMVSNQSKMSNFFFFFT